MTQSAIVEFIVALSQGVSPYLLNII